MTTVALDAFKYHGIIFREGNEIVERLENPLPKACAVYAFRQNGAWLYIGSASGGARGRLTSYLRHQRKGTLKPKHADIAERLDVAPIELWILPIEPRVRMVDGLPVDWLLGVESGLIKTLDPLINRRERIRT